MDQKQAQHDMSKIFLEQDEDSLFLGLAAGKMDQKPARHDLPNIFLEQDEDNFFFLGLAGKDGPEASTTRPAKDSFGARRR
ncbi:hypothetical protein TNCV_4023311 [Trichonephila clavipes]|nr:hypothetical protein TNCV_4023311 [Trichonephila clavipes]